ncbi:uncharacterized protein PFLUO_LOCUS8788 [Penicillium psychrofluorescens]|uniref:uncharacterized protein n=1 Tax=Penicillium psychrofluorescens TaxID=3158075 RepID=UPI003CCCACCD
MDEMDHDRMPSMAKHCFVTVGATASFTQLLNHVATDDFIQALQQHNYTHLTIQYGPDLAYVAEFIDRHKTDTARNGAIEVNGFDFKTEGLSQDMSMAKPCPSENRVGGMILTHAGTGSILEALRLGVPLVVVPNPDLQDNHQMELAREMHRQGYVVATAPEELCPAVRKAEDLRLRRPGWPPVENGRGPRPYIRESLNDELGFLD